MLLGGAIPSVTKFGEQNPDPQVTAKLSCELFTTRKVPIADADWAAPRARISDGSAIVASVQMIDTTKSRSISVKPASPLPEVALRFDMTHDIFQQFCHFSTTQNWLTCGTAPAAGRHISL